MENENNNTDDRRSIYIIKRSFQWRWIMKPILVLFLRLVVVGAVLLFALDQTIGADYQKYIQFGNLTRKVISPSIIISVLGVFIVGALLIIWQFIHFTHQIAGPVYRIEQSLKKIKDCDLSMRISFREKDEFQELSEHFNSALQEIEEPIRNVREQIDDIDASELPEESRDKLERARKEINKFELNDPDNESS